MWIGGGEGTFTGLHRDEHASILCLLKGHKKFLFFPKFHFMEMHPDLSGPAMFRQSTVCAFK
jgi:hypothetical protein